MIAYNCLNQSFVIKLYLFQIFARDNYYHYKKDHNENSSFQKRDLSNMGDDPRVRN